MARLTLIACSAQRAMISAAVAPLMRKREHNPPMLDRQAMARLEGVKGPANQIGKDMHQRKNIVGRAERLRRRPLFDDRAECSAQRRSLGFHEQVLSCGPARAASAVPVSWSPDRPAARPWACGCGSVPTPMECRYSAPSRRTLSAGR